MVYGLWSVANFIVWWYKPVTQYSLTGLVKPLCGRSETYIYIYAHALRVSTVVLTCACEISAT